MRYFIRFGDPPEGGRSKLWSAPNVYMTGQIGQELPGMSVYEVKKLGDKWDILTDNLNSGSGYASLDELLYRAIKHKDYPIYLLTGKPVRWKDFTPEEKKQFERYWPGSGASHYELEGTDGEPLLREFKGLGKLSAMDLVCESHGFPKDFMGLEESALPKQLNEYSFRWQRTEPNRKSYYSSKKAGFPYMVLTASTELKDPNASFILYKVNGKQLLVDWRSNKKLQLTPDYDAKLAGLASKLVRNQDGIEEFAQLYPWYVKDFKLENRAKLFEILVTKMHMLESEFTYTFGEVQDQVRQETLDRFHDAYIMFPDTMRPVRRQQMMTFLQNVDSYLKPNGMGFLLEEGNIAFRPITKRAWGLYYPGVRSEIIISPNIPLGHEAIRTIIHELGHKLQYEFITTTGMGKVMDQFRAAHRTGDKVPAKTIPPEIWKAINTLGTTVEYIGTKRKWKEFSPYRITRLATRTNFKVKMASIKAPKAFSISGPPEFLGSRDYIVAGHRQEDPTELSSVNTWFPTAYSRKEPWEWFCECFSYYIMGKLEGPPKEWMEAFLAEYRN